MKRWFLLFTTLVSAAACGDDSRPGNPPKGPGGGSGEEEGEKVLITTYDNTPLFMAYRDEGGEWLDPTEVSTGNFEIRVNGPYEVVTVCGAADRPRTSLRRFVLEDGAEQKVSCINYGPEPTMTKVSGQMVQPGSVFMYNLASSTAANWSFNLDVATGAHELIAYDSGNIVIERDLDIQANTTVNTVDLASGAALLPKTFTFTGTRGDDTVSTETDLITPNELVYLAGSDSTVKVVPDDALGADDLQVVMASASNGTARRTIELTPGDSAPRELNFMPRLSGVRLEPEQAVWASIPQGATGISQYTPGDAPGGERRLSLVVSKGWMASHADQLVATGELKIDLAIPNYDDAWRIDPTNHFATLMVTDDVDSIQYSSSVSDRVGGARAPDRSRDEDRERLVRP